MHLSSTQLVCSKEHLDGHEPECLIVGPGLRAKGFMVSHFIPPPVDICVTLAKRARLLEVIVVPHVGRHRARKFRLSCAEGLKGPYVDTGRHLFADEETRHVVVQSDPSARAASTRCTPVILLPANMPKIQRLRLTVLGTVGSTIPCVGSLQVIVEGTQADAAQAERDLRLRVEAAHKRNSLFGGGGPVFDVACSGPARPASLASDGDGVHAGHGAANTGRVSAHAPAVAGPPATAHNTGGVAGAAAVPEGAFFVPAAARHPGPAHLAGASASAVPPEFLDAITDEIMRVPMMLPSRNVVDVSTLQRLMDTSGGVDPYTGVAMKASDALPHVSLKARLDAHHTAYPGLRSNAAAKPRGERPWAAAAVVRQRALNG